MSFANEKLQFLKKPDKSGIKGIDREIMPLVNLINSKEEYFTTSSCSGRIILMPETGKKQENVFLFVSHKKISFEDLKKQLNSAIRYKGIIYLKMEPCIMHVACDSLNSAIRLVNKARNSGWKKSGIISKRNIIETLSTEHLECPVADKGKVIIDNNYLKIAAKECNKKLAQTRNKIKQLEKEL